jgi:hypothetical protein
MDAMECIILKDPVKFYSQFSEVREEFKALRTFDIKEPDAHRKMWRERIKLLRDDCSIARYNAVLHDTERALQSELHDAPFAKRVPLNAKIQLLATMKSAYFRFWTAMDTVERGMTSESHKHLLSPFADADQALSSLCYAWQALGKKE